MAHNITTETFALRQAQY